jgi:hypothetical protein
MSEDQMSALREKLLQERDVQRQRASGGDSKTPGDKSGGDKSEYDSGVLYTTPSYLHSLLSLFCNNVHTLILQHPLTLLLHKQLSHDTDSVSIIAHRCLIGAENADLRSYCTIPTLSCSVLNCCFTHRG